MRAVFASFGLILAAACLPAPAAAHHSYAAFDRCQPVTLEGDVDSVEWVNPHIRIHMRTADSGAYFVEWFSLIQLQQAGIEPDTLKAGDRILVSGSAMRDPSMKVLSLLTEIRRMADGWHWERARQAPADCGAPVASGAN